MTTLTGRVNQKQRTRTAIVDAARALLAADEAINMSAIAKRALVSEATAYRYFPDLAAVLREAMAVVVWTTAADTLAPLEGNPDPVTRIGFATEALLREVLAHERTTRAIMSAAILKPDTPGQRPGRRFGLIDHALTPLDDTLAATDPDRVEQLKRSLAIVVSAEALFTLMDLCKLSPDEAIQCAVHTAQTLTRAALSAPEPPTPHPASE